MGRYSSIYDTFAVYIDEEYKHLASVALIGWAGKIPFMHDGCFHGNQARNKVNIYNKINRYPMLIRGVVN